MFLVFTNTDRGLGGIDVVRYTLSSTHDQWGAKMK